LSNNDHYEDHEISLIWQVKRTDENATALARLLGRNEGGVKFVWRYCEEVAEKGLEGIGPRSSKHLAAQIYLYGFKRIGMARMGAINTLVLA
jgi:hypothetical protein